MSNKIAVQLRKWSPSSHRYNRLRYCTHCGNYTSLSWHAACPTCEKEGHFIELDRLAGRITSHRRVRDYIWTIVIACCAIWFSNSTTDLIYSLAAIPISLLVITLLHKRYRSALDNHALQRLLLYETPLIRQGLDQDEKQAAHDMNEEHYKDAYEKLREASGILNKESIKAAKLHCLNRFILRSDMDLELDTLVPNRFDQAFVLYMHQVIKLNPQLVRSSVLDYVMKYKADIEKHMGEQGDEIMAAAAGAALRMRIYVVRYSDLIRPYMVRFSRDRLLRLIQMLDTESDGSLKPMQKQALYVARTNYHYDPEFQPYLERAN
jgi:hypothetical protein